MAANRITVPYNRDLKPLEDLLTGVRRPGDFMVQGSIETPMPRLEVEGVGVISFPVLESQVRQMIEHASRAPYGRGDQTLVDEAVRRSWQLPARLVHLGGKAWENTFRQIRESVLQGLGCTQANVAAELYKLLIYEPGGFFAAHRDTEKAGGMFGTLVVTLPSAYRGGELVVRHAGREVVADLSSDECSELKFAAFYADCEHEVRPVQAGHRVCLIYNLIQLPLGKTNEPLVAPQYASEIHAASAMLEAAFAPPGGLAKLAWLLQHQYSPAGLSFAGLKGEDAARAKVLRLAAERTGCVVHLGIIHIEETGPAEPIYGTDYGYGRRRRWRDDEEEVAGHESYEVVEVSDWSRYIDHWKNVEDQPVAYGTLPLQDGEVLPAGALDDEDPDEQRLTEATGNEGASFERSYHRAALVIWPRERCAEVLLQAGVAAALPHLAERLATGDAQAGLIAKQIIAAWESSPSPYSLPTRGQEPSRAEMLRLLRKRGDRTLLEQFIAGVVTRDYDGSENDELAAAAQRLGPNRAGTLLAALARENMPQFYCACVSLLGRMIRTQGEKLDAEWQTALRDVAAVMVRALAKLQPTVDLDSIADWRRAQTAKPADGALVADLLDCLRAIGAAELRMEAASAIIQNPTCFDPGNLLVPTLNLLAGRNRDALFADVAVERLWIHTAESLLARSEQPPAPPTDWRQAVRISCTCDDCRGLQKFAADPEAQVAHFRVRKERRQHLHNQIEGHGLDMTHATERRGSPQTLVCTKTRATYQRQCEQHRQDCAGMRSLLKLFEPVPESLHPLARRLTAAHSRHSPT